MPHRVAGRVDHLCGGISEADCVTLANRFVKPGKTMSIGGGPDHGRAISTAYRFHRSDVVIVMMGEDDRVQPPSGCINRLYHWRFFSWIDDRREAGGSITDKPGVVVRENGDRRYRNGHKNPWSTGVI